jgi:nicotinate-nucleotide--dimethylbenzimidazole phosphoribosyltransferase
MKNAVLKVFLAALLLCAPRAYAQTAGAYQGYAGNAPQEPHAAAPQVAAPQVSAPQAPAAPAAPAAPVQAQAAAPAPPPDPCAAYKTSYQVYVACQDRVQKIQRMRDAMKSREDELTVPAAPVQGVPPVIPHNATVLQPPAPPTAVLQLAQPGQNGAAPPQQQIPQQNQAQTPPATK